MSDEANKPSIAVDKLLSAIEPAMLGAYQAGYDLGVKHASERYATSLEEIKSQLKSGLADLDTRWGHLLDLRPDEKVNP